MGRLSSQLGFFISILLITFTSHSDDRIYKVNTRTNEIKIMAYNLQNMFDSTHDESKGEHKNDYEFLPKDSEWKQYCPGGNWKQSCLETDWTATKVRRKMRRVKEALELQGSLPDILALSEVENPNVVGQLAKVLGYDDFYMTDSPDKRGIDLAILYLKEKMTAIDYVEKELEESMYPTRNASAVHFRLTEKFGGGVLGVYPVHWPSQRGPVQARIYAAKTVRKLVNAEKRKYRNEKYQAVILGDFNVTEQDSPHPVRSVLLDRGWSNQFLSTRELASIYGNPHLERMPQGTYYYGPKNAWNMFDQILVTKSLNDGEGLEIMPKSYRIHAPKAISQENDHGERIPFRYNHKTNETKWTGYSDHYAVHVKLRYRSR